MVCECEECAACFGVAHTVCAVDDGAVVDEHLVDGWGGAVAFQTADVAAVAGFAVDVDGDVADFGGGAEGAVDDASVVDDAEAYAFADEVVGEVGFAVAVGVEEGVGEYACAGVLFDEDGDGEAVGEFVDEVDGAPALHGGYDGGVAVVAQVGAGDGHADGHDGGVFVQELFDGAVHGGDGFADGVV